jgi:hypothetical protein
VLRPLQRATWEFIVRRPNTGTLVLADSAPSGYNSPSVGLDLRNIMHAPNPPDWRMKFWHSAPTADNGQQWYTSQHRWP